MDKTKALTKEKNESVKLMWQYANWEWKTIIVLGVLALIYLFGKLGQYIGRLIG